jgi:hypothetical protein
VRSFFSSIRTISSLTKPAHTCCLHLIVRSSYHHFLSSRLRGRVLETCQYYMRNLRLKKDLKDDLVLIDVVIAVHNDTGDIAPVQSVSGGIAVTRNSWHCAG